MDQLDMQSLQYGIIYVCGNPKQTHNLRWFATMIQPMIRPLTLQWVETWDFDHTIIAARRFNVGNMGKYATVQLHLNAYGQSDSYSLLAAVHAFSDCLQDVMDASEGDVVINEADYNDRNQPAQGKWGRTTSSTTFQSIIRESEVFMPQDHTRVESTAHKPDPDKHSLSKFLRRFKQRSRRKGRLDQEVEHIDEDIRYHPSHPSHPSPQALPGSINHYSKKYHEDEGCFSEDVDEEATAIDIDIETDIETQDVQEFIQIESEYQRDVNDLRARIVAFIAKYHQDPRQVITSMLQGKVLLGAVPSHVLVNGDMKIVLPEYDEMEIKMPAMCRTLYILFMKRRMLGGTGIVLRDIEEYRDEIIDIYSLVKPGASEDKVEETVSNLCNPLGDSLNQMISRANRCIKNVITDQELAQRYLITGTRGEEYGIELDPEFMTLPRAVTGA